MKLPYLIKNRFNVYYLRFSIPKKKYPKHEALLRVHYSSAGLRYRQITISFRVQSFQEAKQIYFSVIGCAMAEFHLLKREMLTMENTNQLVRNFKQTVARAIESAKNPNAPKWLPHVHAWELKQMFMSELQNMNALESESAKQAKRDQQLLEDANKTIKALSRSVMSAPMVASVAKPTPKHSLKDELDRYIRYKQGADWNLRSFDQNKGNLMRFVEIVGVDKDVEELTIDDIQLYADIMFKLPKNAGKERSKQEFLCSQDIFDFWFDLAEENTNEILKPNGVEKHFSIVRGFLKNLHTKGLTERDFAGILKVSKGSIKKTSEKRSTFDTETLSKMFSSYIYSNYLRRGESPKTFHFWAPLIGLTTGMRIGEIAALEVTDIVEVDEVKCFDLNTTWFDSHLKAVAPEKSKKNESSLRLIPIPKVLWKIGLDQLINGRKSGLLFDDLRLNAKKGLGNEVSRWYHDCFRKHAGLPKRTEHGEQLVFHSLRHTFTTLLDRTFINEIPLKSEMAKYVTGHSDNSVRSKTYNHGYDMSKIAKYIDAIDFGVDLNALSYGRFLKRSKSPEV